MIQRFSSNKSIYFLIFFSLAIHFITLFLDHTIFQDWLWIHEPFHSLIEVLGGSIAIGVGYFLFQLEKNKSGTRYNHLIALALLVMGFLDICHAGFQSGNSFVWFHSIATFFGGFFFFLICLPTKKKHQLSRKVFISSFVSIILITTLSFLFPEYIPRMVVDGKFTFVAKLLNLMGGGFLFIAGIKLSLDYRKYKNEDDLLFVIHCFLFAAAAIMFEESQLWDLLWWGWHILRFLAYLAALIYIIISYQKSDLKIKEELELAAEISEKEKRLALAVHGSLVGIWDWPNTNEDDQWWSPEFYEILNYKTQDIKSGFESFKSLLHPEDKEKVFAVVKENYKNNTQIDLEYRLKMKSGDYRWVESRSQIYQGFQDGFKRMIGTIIDIHDKKIHENENDMLRHRLSLATQSAKIGIWDWDIVLDHLIWDDQMYLLYGINKNNNTDPLKLWQDCLHSQDKEKLKLKMRSAIEGEDKFDEVFRVIHSDKSIHYIQAYGTVLRDGDNNPMRMIGVNWDMTELKKIENDLRRSNAELARFADIASHDLQEPLRKITNYISVLDDEIRDILSEDQIRYFGYINDAACRMRELIRDVLDFSRINHEGLSKELVNFNTLMKDVAQTLEVSINDKNAEIIYDNLPQVSCSQNLMKLVLQNLIQNAIKFSRPKVVPKIYVRAEYSEDGWVFSIQDNGIGIESEYIDNIFEVFVRLHRRTEYSGTGIGLSIVKRIIDKHGGKVWIKSNFGEGSTFYFNLPDH